MDNVTLYPELIDYIYWYCNRFQTPSEKLAVKTFMHDKPGISETERKMCIRQGWISDEADVKKIIEGGFESFKEQVAIRILKEHQNELGLNFCPICFKIARTPFAKQCRFCLHDWH
jgi:hypothetical protein